ncbi:MAG: hypothetical protein PVG78_05365 [Desulfobacterales bacterium]
MKFRFASWFLGIMLLLPAPAPAQGEDAGFSQFRREIQQILSALSGDLNRFEDIQRELDSSGRSSANYDEQKNLWISTILSITAISSICEYENDQLSLFLDLKPERRIHFMGVRTKSLEISIAQIDNLREQIQINHSLMTRDLAEIHLMERIDRTIDSSRSLLGRSLALLHGMGGEK